jgi:hypothetical protein
LFYNVNLKETAENNVSLTLESKNSQRIIPNIIYDIFDENLIKMNKI